MQFSPEEKIAESFTAPVGCAVLTHGTKVIEHPGWYQTITPSIKEPSKNEIILSQIPENEVDDVVGKTICEYRSLDLPIKWCVGPLTSPQNLGEKLGRLGFSSWDIRGMGCNPMELELKFPREIKVEKVTQGNLDDFAQTVVLGWKPEKAEDKTEVNRSRADFEWSISQPNERYQFFLARFNGEPVGTAGFILKSNSAYLIGGNIVPKFRGRGIYRALIEERLRVLRKLNVRLATTQAREATSAPMLERLGFETYFRSKIYQLLPDQPLLG